MHGGEHQGRKLEWCDWCDPLDSDDVAILLAVIGPPVMGVRIEAKVAQDVVGVGAAGDGEGGRL